MSRTSPISISRRFHAELHYFVLSHLDLGPDAASIFEPSRAPPAWTEDLCDAYRRANGRLAVQMLPLHTADLTMMLEYLTERSLPALADPDGQRLCDRLVDALTTERDAAQRAWQRDQDRAEARAAQAATSLTAPLADLREILWSKAGRAPPPLTVLDCPSLGNRRATHGRGLHRPDAHVIAVSLLAPPEQALIQVLHEEVHAVTDPPIRASFATQQQTWAGSVGLELHARLEREAVETGRRLIAKHAPTLRSAYDIWLCRYGLLRRRLPDA